MSIINFTVHYDELTNDTTDNSGDIGTTPVIGEFRFVPQVPRGQRALAPGYSPRPTAFPFQAFTGYLDVDGRLKNAAGGTPGVRLWANDPVLNLARLPYRVEASLTDPLGNPIPWEPFIFEAPAADEVVYLTSVMRVPGRLAQGLSMGPPGPQVFFEEVTPGGFVDNGDGTAMFVAGTYQQVDIDGNEFGTPISIAFVGTGNTDGGSP